MEYVPAVGFVIGGIGLVIAAYHIWVYGRVRFSKLIAVLPGLFVPVSSLVVALLWRSIHLDMDVVKNFDVQLLSTSVILSALLVLAVQIIGGSLLLRMINRAGAVNA